MSVFTRGKSGIYSYSFQIKGRTFFGTTGCTTKPEALAYEELERAKAIVEVARYQETHRTPRMTFDAALERLWEEVGQFYKGTYRATVETALAWLLEKSGIGGTTRLCDIGPSKVSEAVARRRGEGVGNATVNRTVTELLRLLMIRARDQWEQEGLKAIAWGTFMLPETKERIRALKTQDEPTLLDTMRDDYVPAIQFMIKSGFRKFEVIGLMKADLDFGNKTISVIGKGNKAATIPMSSELREILFPLMGNPTDHVFTFVSPRTSVNPKTKKKYIRGQHYPLTYSGLGTAWRRYGAAKAGITDFHLHDLRHTAATRLLRGGKANLRVVQKLMRHADLATTAKYAHAFDEDVLEAMEAETSARQEAPLQSPLHDVSKSA